MSKDPLTFTEVFQTLLGEESERAENVQTPGRVEHSFSEEELAVALEHKQFEIFYQPKIHAVGRGLAGAEALLRWKHPDLGMLLPDQFLGSAEKTGFIQQLGAWVIRQVGSFNLILRSEHPNFLGRLSINVSPSQFNDSAYLAAMLKATERFSFPNKFLEIELTEKGVLHDLTKAAALMKMICDYGISIAIDDFGTGFSSMQTLATLPISTVKLDISFIRRIRDSDTDRKIVRSILALCKEMGITTVAEGVEDEEQAEILTSWECDQFQGFLFYQALPVQFFRQLVS